MKPTDRRRDRHSRIAATGGLMISIGMSGCVDTSAGQVAGRPDVRAAIASGAIRSPKAASVAMASVEGAPEAITLRLKQDMASEAANREITITDPSLARYFVRGYLDAYPTETGTSVHYVWDVFDTAKQRQQRVDDAFDVASPTGGDPWSGVSEEVVASIASRSADDLAIFLGKTPEATATAPAADAVAHTAN